MKKIKEIAKKVLLKLKPSKFQLIWMLVLFISFCGIFCSGALSKQTYSETLANDVSLKVKEGEAINIVCRGRENNNVMSKQTFASTINSKFKSKYPFTCVMGYNFNKTINCSLDELGPLGENLSFITSSYFTNDGGENSDVITFHAYKVELLFKEPNTQRTEEQANFVYISKSQADYLIESNAGFLVYKDLLNTSITFRENGNSPVKWKIANIYNDNGLFCNEAKKSLNNYVICFSYLSDTLKRTESAMFSFYDFAYSNIEYFNHIKREFPAESYEFLTRNNDADATSVKLANYFNNIFEMNEGSQVFSIILLIVSLLPFFVFAFILLKKEMDFSYLIQFLFISLFSWLLFYFISLISKSVLFFSSFSLIVFLILTLVVLFVEFEFLIMDKYERKNK